MLLPVLIHKMKHFTFNVTLTTQKRLQHIYPAPLVRSTNIKMVSCINVIRLKY